MVYLQRASDPVDVRKGEWRLWEAPQAVELATDIYERTKKSDDVTLTPGSQQGSGGSRASNVAMSSTCGLKRTKVSPASPESIAKSARTLWNTNRDRMRAQWLEYFPKLFQYYKGKLHFCIDNCTAGLRFNPEPYAPTLKYFTSGYLQYIDVTPYDIKWLKWDKNREEVPESQREKFEPAEVWTEDRWIFCRRMAGDELCAVLFYKMATFIWRSNEIQGHDMREYQDALITHVFGYTYKDDFLPKLKSSLSVVTWDGKNQVRLDSEYIERMFKEVLLLGPLAAMYGREIEQILIQNYMPEMVSEDEFAFSVQQGRASIKKIPLRAMNVDESYEEEEDRRADDEYRGRDSRY